MIIHKLIAHHLKHGDDEEFYLLQARDAIDWLEKRGIRPATGLRALDLGCGHGVFGAELVKRGWAVTFADESNYLLPSISTAEFRTINVDREDVGTLGQYNLVICSNVLEHLAQPERFIRSIPNILRPGGCFYLSWTNWLSPWGGHEFSPFHYLGARHGHLVFDKLRGRPRKHTPFENLFPTSIGRTLKLIRSQPGLTILATVPRYFTEWSILVRVPGLREFVTWNCAILIKK